MISWDSIGAQMRGKEQATKKLAIALSPKSQLES